jgi:hypothetical protein
MRIACINLGIILLLCITTIHSYAQNPSYQLTVESGGYVDFKIHSMQQYENVSGIDYTNWTRLKIVFKDTTAGVQEWKLGFKANTSDFLTNVPGRVLPLNYVSIDAVDGDTLQAGDGNTSIYIENSPQPLTDASYTSLVTGADEGTYRLYINYHCDSTLLQKYPDYYLTEIIYKIVPQGDPFE